jgi:concanavalin A-like lectin/glucanase superfamily protein
MKKQIFFTTVIFSAIGFFSCQKDKSALAPDTPNVQESNTAVTYSETRYNPITYKLAGLYTFDNTLAEQTGKLPNAISNKRWYSFGTDRKGNSKSAIAFDSTYGLTIANVPQQTNTTVAAWVKYTTVRPAVGFITSYGVGPHLFQVQNMFIGTVEVDNDGSLGTQIGSTVNSAWHHVAVTYDGAYVKLYIDGVLRNNFPATGSIAPQTVKYYLGYNWLGDYWKGYIDDLRFYSRTLTASDVTALYNL